MLQFGADDHALEDTDENNTTLVSARHGQVRSDSAEVGLDLGVGIAVDMGVERESVTLKSGRRYELQAGDDADRLVVRSRSGQVLLRVEVGDRGPLLSFESAEIELRARDKLSLAAPEVALSASDKLTVQCDGDVDERIGGNHHSRIEGEERLEAAAVRMQANEDAMQLRAVNRIALDGEHIGLNDEPCPVPFDWSAIANEADDDDPDTDSQGADAPADTVPEGGAQ